ncbi:MAG: hypothetical protein ACQER0_05525 [Bacillota bacterium]
MLKPSKKLVYFTIRFILVYVLTYIFIGVIFMNFENYASAFIQIEEFSNFRDPAAKIIQWAPFFQIFRAAFFAFILYPFYQIIIKSDYNWLKLFCLIWGFSLVGSVAPIPGSIEGFIYTDLSLTEHLIRIPEVTIQIFVFSWFFAKWENRTERDYSQ